MTKVTSILGAAAGALLFSGLALAQGPDVIVYDVGVDGGDPNDIHYYGQSGGIAAYSIATQSCNNGSSPLDWYSSNLNHPVIGQNMFRYKDGRMEQLGQSWLKHGFCAVNEFESGCQPCNSSNCDTLGVGCADTYWATLNDGQGGGPKWRINAVTGAHTHGPESPSGPGTIRGRLQCAVSDMEPAQNPGAEYFIECQYVANDDQLAGNVANNASWRPVNVNSVSNITGGGSTVQMQPAIYAWLSVDAGVGIKPAVNLNEGGSGVHGYFYVGSRKTDLGGGLYRYEYAVQNLSSEQGAGSFSVPVGLGVNLTDIYFHDVDYHSGEPYDGTDWGATVGGGAITWEVAADYATNPNGNAIRWGTLYNFGFTANANSISSTATIGLFEPGTGTTVTSPIPAPGPVTPVGIQQCFCDAANAPCSNPYGTGGCTNSTGVGAICSATGSESIAAQGSSPLVLHVTQARPSKNCVWLQGAGPSVQTAFKDGNLCVGNPTLRLPGFGCHPFPIATLDLAGNLSTDDTVYGFDIVATALCKGDDIAAAAPTTREYQLWYRDGMGPCNTGSNLTNSVLINWVP